MSLLRAFHEFASELTKYAGEKQDLKIVMSPELMYSLVYNLEDQNRTFRGYPPFGSDPIINTVLGEIRLLDFSSIEKQLESDFVPLEKVEDLNKKYAQVVKEKDEVIESLKFDLNELEGEKC